MSSPLRFPTPVPEGAAAESEGTDARSGALVGASQVMRRALATLDVVAPSDSTVLVEGETGTGKGTFAWELHQRSPRRRGPFEVFDCASVAESLIESELFGHERGAFTGAVAPRVGCLARAGGGTLFIDEIDDLPLDLQPKLLRAIEERKVRPVGGDTPVAFDARVVVASKKNLWEEARAGRFREDLFFRLSVFTVQLPPLRERSEDVPLLMNALAGEPLWERLSTDVQQRLLTHSWPGNVRELRNAVERSRHLDAGTLTAEALLLRTTTVVPPSTPPSLPGELVYEGPFKDRKDAWLRHFEREYLTRLLAKTGHNIAKAAREAGLDRKHLYSLLHKYGLLPTPRN